MILKWRVKYLTIFCPKHREKFEAYVPEMHALEMFHSEYYFKTHPDRLMDQIRLKDQINLFYDISLGESRQHVGLRNIIFSHDFICKFIVVAYNVVKNIHV